MSDIKIFVSHRIDLESQTVDNHLYFPVKCGAIYCESCGKDIRCFFGDDKGEHISQKRMSFCEFTVQFWAWKNMNLDYYGVCHYRRYLSFSNKTFKKDAFNMVRESTLWRGSVLRHHLLDANAMEQTITAYDVLVSEYADVLKIPTPKGKQSTVYDLWSAHIDSFFEKKYFDMMFDLIETMAPEYSRSAKEYFAGHLHRGFNCFVMKKELFERLCEFQFPIMFAIEKELDPVGYSETMLRTPAFVGEMLYGVFIYHISTYESWKIRELQLVFFDETMPVNSVLNLICRWAMKYIKSTLRTVINLIFPIGSSSRQGLKKLLKKYF